MIFATNTEVTDFGFGSPISLVKFPVSLEQALLVERKKKKVSQAKKSYVKVVDIYEIRFQTQKNYI